LIGWQKIVFKPVMSVYFEPLPLNRCQKIQMFLVTLCDIISFERVAGVSSGQVCSS